MDDFGSAARPRRGFWTRRRTLVAGSAVGAVGVAALLARSPLMGSQTAGRPVIGYLGSDSRPGLERFDALVSGLSDLGYGVGRTLTIERRLSQDQTGEGFNTFAAELLELEVKVFVTSGTPALVAAAKATSGVPIVAAGPNRSLEDIGLAETIARPGHNVTGVETDPRLDAKGVELLRDMVPTLSRVAYVRNVVTPGTEGQLDRARAAGRSLGVDILDFPVRAPDDINTAFDLAARVPVGGVVISTDFLFGDPSGWRVLELARQYRIPAIYTQVAGYVDQGGLMAYAPDYVAFHHRAATFVDKLLHGTRPTDLPVEQAMTFDFVINLKAAEALGIDVPKHVLLQTTSLIE